MSESNGVVNDTEKLVTKLNSEWIITLLLSFFLWILWVHRFYNWKIWTWILMILTLWWLGIWATIDFIFILVWKFKKKDWTIIPIKV